MYQEVIILTFEYGGYAGRILRVDLSKNETKVLPLDKELARNYLGGTGFCAKILYDETNQDTDPLGPENRLVVATGPLTGTLWPASGRLNFAAKSPLTRIWGESNAGGHFGAGLKFAGYDALIIQGSAKEPVYLWIDDESVEIRKASHLWGKMTDETDKILKEDIGDEKIQVAAIGPAGENLVRFSSIVNTISRVAARAGMGAVMGSKKLKAIAVRGSKDVVIHDSERFFELLENFLEKIKNDPFAMNITKYGTTQLVAAMNEIGRFPTKNFQTGVYPMAHKIDGDTIVTNYKVKDRACFACPFACKNYITVKLGSYAGLSGEHPEYETINAFGSRVWNDDIELIFYVNSLCNKYGLDTISTGSAVAFAMELWEKGILTKDDTDGLDFSWGNKETITKMVHKIAKREGFGNVFADGIVEAAKRIGKGSEKYAMHVKGLDIPAQDGRAQKSMAIAHAASVRGADHLRHCTFYDEMGFENAIAKKFGKQYLPEMADRLEVKYKGIMAKETEDFAVFVNALPLCVSGGSYWPPILWFEDVLNIYNAVTGINTSLREFRMIAERVVNLKRAYNIRLCLSRKDDTLPERFLKEPAPDGPCKGHIVDIETLIDEYYKERGWDLKTGLIPRKKLEELGLKEVADELQRIGKLPEQLYEGMMNAKI